MKKIPKEERRARIVSAVLAVACATVFYVQHPPYTMEEIFAGKLFSRPQQPISAEEKMARFDKMVQLFNAEKYIILTAPFSDSDFIVSINTYKDEIDSLRAKKDRTKQDSVALREAEQQIAFNQLFGNKQRVVETLYNDDGMIMDESIFSTPIQSAQMCDKKIIFKLEPEKP